MTIRQLPKTVTRSVSGYELFGKAVTGWAGEVYRARDVGNDATVALHALPAELISEPFNKSQLRADFQAAVKCEHPNILRAIELGYENEVWFLATEWVEGITLAHMLDAHSRLPEETAVRIVAQIGQAIDYSFAAGHSPCLPLPSNILIRNDGVAKLMAFSLADGVQLARRSSAEAATNPPRSAAAPAPNYNFSDAIRAFGGTLFEAATGVEWTHATPLPVEHTRRVKPRARRLGGRPTGLNERIDLAVRWATDPDAAVQPPSCAEWLKALRAKSRTPATPKRDVRPGGTKSDNRRAFVRYSVGVGTQCTINTSVFECDPQAAPDASAVWPLIVRDISVGGIGILLARRCEPGTELFIELVTENNQVTRSLPVRVVRVRRDTIGHWTHGCEFVTPLESHEMLAVLGHLGRVDPW